MLNKSLLLRTNPPAIMFRLVHNTILDASRSSVNFEYTYTDPSTKQTVTKRVNSSDSEYTFPCAIGDTVTFSNLLDKRPMSYLGTLFMNGADVSPNGTGSFKSTFSVTVNGESPYIEYFFDDTRH